MNKSTRSVSGTDRIKNAKLPNQPTKGKIIYYLTFCLALQSIGVSTLSTIFARKISTFDQGIELFGISATAFSLAAMVSAPLMGLLVDKLGKYRLLLGSLAAHALASLSYLLVSTGAGFTAVRALAGGLTAGLVPATISLIGDLTTQEERGRWIGFVTGWSSAGFVIGPYLGGWIYDHWGLAAPFFVGAIAHAISFLIVLWLIPDLSSNQGKELDNNPRSSMNERGIFPFLSRLQSSIPQHTRSILMLGVISFLAVFAWRFVEPQFHFYIYDDLVWTSSRFGFLLSGYGILSMICGVTLGGLSDRFGRKTILAAGLIVHTAQYFALITTDSYLWILLGVAGSGLGEGLFMPALNAYFLDVSPDHYHGRVIGFKEAMFSLGGLAGPALVIFVFQYLQPASIFIIGGSLIFLSALLVLFLSEPAKQRVPIL
jgi:MFS family permease